MITTVADASQVAQARRLVGDFARIAGIPAPRLAQIAIVVTELATNLLKHAGSGQILASQYADGTGSGVELLALDRGNGMIDVGRCMDDGYSTAGSPGNGLGAIERLADDLQIYSRPGLGSAIMVRFRQHAASKVRSTLLGSAVAPYPGETLCGDGWAFDETGPFRTMILADGAGHGPEAARAAQVAVQAFEANAGEPCEELMACVHRALMPTRGAAVAIARIDMAAGVIRYVGVGNISGLLVTDAPARHMVSHNGTAGHVAPRIREFSYEFTGTPMVILHSDGLTSRWDLGAYPGLGLQHPTLVAGVLLRDHRRARDDASVTVARPLL